MEYSEAAGKPCVLYKISPMIKAIKWESHDGKKLLISSYLESRKGGTAWGGGYNQSDTIDGG